MDGQKRKIGRPTKRPGMKAEYRQVAVTPEAHTKLKVIADQTGETIIDTIDKLVGVE